MTFRRRAFGIVGYLANWEGYGTSQNHYTEHAEFFASLSGAKLEMYTRSKGYGYLYPLTFNDFDEITGVKEREYVETPGTWDEQYMTLRVVYYDDSGKLTYSDEPKYTLDIGPRGGVRTNDG
jgi:hypothetical protein